MPTPKIIRNVVGWLLAAIIIFILIRTIYTHWDDLRAWEWRVHWAKLLLSVLFMAGAYLTASQGWRTLLVGFGYRIRLHEAFRVVYLAQLGRYIPGKIWQVIGMVGLAREIGIPSAVALASFVLVQAYALPAAFLLIFATMGSAEWIDSLMIYRNIFYIFMAAILVVFLVLFCRPGGLHWALNKLLVMFKRDPVSYQPGFGNRISIFALYLLTWFLFGISFHFFLGALLKHPQHVLQNSAGIYIAAYNIGYIAFFSPGGLGFREGVMTALLSPGLTQPVAASIALINRVWITAAEAVVSLLAILTYRLKRR
ncbi:MAG: flippase-like domain-containing protein [Candidatus Zixiibacteriota bacterium]|nr:MAG: flippase-like domain-containing protein [candidate division Zixibacteria bacterium]